MLADILFVGLSVDFWFAGVLEMGAEVLVVWMLGYFERRGVSLHGRGISSVNEPQILADPKS